MRLLVLFTRKPHYSIFFSIAITEEVCNNLRISAQVGPTHGRMSPLLLGCAVFLLIFGTYVL